MKKQSKTSLFATLRKVFRMALEAEKRQTDAQEITEHAEEFRRSRRRFLENAGKATLIGAALPTLQIPGLKGFISRAVMPRIVIVGGGIAGLNALHTLKKSGLDATIYEASNRCGGRMFTVIGAMGEGSWTEFGGEFVDTDHKDMWDLAEEFRLELIDYAQESEAALTKEAFFFNGEHYTLAQVVEEFRGFAPRMKADMDKLGDEISYKTKSRFVKKLDRTSLSKYLESIGASGWIKRFVEVAYESEYGLSPAVQSSLNLLLLISPDTPNGEFELFGTSDERYKIRGGNQRIPDALAKEYTNHIELNRPMESIRAVGKEYALTFSGMSEAVMADFVILTVPFTILRNLEMKLEMPKVKRKCINTLGYGTNAKLMLGMRNHVWRTQGYTGLCYSDNGVPNGWDNAQLQTPDRSVAGLSILFGGPGGLQVGQGSPEEQKDKYLPLWDKIYPGVANTFNGKVARMDWPTYKFNLGSYVCPTLGQYTSISGAEQMPLGNVYFAGEHCGGEYAGFMNGAAKSGREAAEAIIAKMR
ncbi:MAG: FAD-dependent oxidoreductase [Lewinellaceae bacterium]|nr:FAD-dependent oxidoreductase [Saprospiraceae bacterium]MCB9342887.1 FAD-dependent oxidoreductase [Lewinellaceae bacterium]